MIQLNLTLDGVESTYNIPTGWEDISLAKFSEMFATDVSDLHKIEQSVKHISILSGIPEDTLYEFSPLDFNTVATYFKFMYEPVPNNNSESIIIDGEEYFLKTDFKTLSFGEQTSIEIILEANNGDVMKCMDKLLCIFLRKKNEAGELEKFSNSFMKRVDKFKSIPIASVYSIFTFFLNMTEA